RSCGKQGSPDFRLYISLNEMILQKTMKDKAFRRLAKGRSACFATVFSKENAFSPARRGDNDMDFTLTDEQRQLQEQAAAFAAEKVTGIARELEDKNIPLPHEWLKRLAEMGYLGINLDAADGGAGATHLDAAIVLEAVAKVSPAVAFPIFESCFG